MSARASSALALALALIGGGCADASARAEIARLRQTVDDLRRPTDRDRHTAHELENRVFLLEDRVDTARVTQERSPAAEGAIPHLPVVTLAPEPAPEPEPRPDPEPGESAAYDDVVLDGPPLVIRMDGRTRAERPARAPADDEIDLAAVDERLPVVPLRRPRPPAPGADDAVQRYQEAYQALRRQEHAAAIAALRAFIERHPAHDLADNAQYWLGEAYYDQADYRTALVEFRAVLRRYPDGNKAPDALLKVGFCLARLGDPGAAMQALAQVQDIFPRSNAARLAVKRLDELRRTTR
jgi:tol-pal system protein YbgF